MRGQLEDLLRSSEIISDSYGSRCPTQPTVQRRLACCNERQAVRVSASLCESLSPLSLPIVESADLTSSVHSPRAANIDSCFVANNLVKPFSKDMDDLDVV